MTRKMLYIAVTAALGTAVFGLLAAQGAFFAAVVSLVPWGGALVALRLVAVRDPSGPSRPPPHASGAAEELAAALVKLNDAVVVADATGHVVSMSPVAQSLSGWTEADAEGRPLSEVCRFQHGDGENVLEGAAKAKKTHASERSTTLIRPDGSQTPIAYVLSPMMGRHGARRLLLVFRDITEQVEVESALRKSEGDFAELIERSPDVVVVVDGLRVVYANPAFVAALGYRDPRDIVGERIDTLAAGEERSALLAFMRGTGSVREGETHRTRFRRRRSGWAVLDIVPPQFTRWKGKSATLLVMRNMSDRIELEQRLSRAERLAALGTLAAGVAHEIHNPLSYILVNLEIISDEL